MKQKHNIYYRKLTTSHHEPPFLRWELVPFTSGDYYIDLAQIKFATVLEGSFVRLSKTTYNKEGKQMKFRKDAEEEIRDYFLRHDDPGNCLVDSVGINGHNKIVSVRYICDRGGCNCLGHWYSGNPHDAREWIMRADILKEGA